MIIKRINNNIVHVRFKTQKELAETLIRFQEYYESPKFKNKIFTLGEIRQYYCNRFGSFTYFEDTAGFNFPSSSLKPFYSGLFDPLTKGEQKFLDTFKNRPDNFYIIGTYTEEADYETECINHELAHALYHTNPKYKKDVEKALKSTNTDRMFKGLTKIGYHLDVCLDEAHAYLATGVDVLVENKIWYCVDTADKMRKLTTKYINLLKANQIKHFDP